MKPNPGDLISIFGFSLYESMIKRTKVFTDRLVGFDDSPELALCIAFINGNVNNRAAYVLTPTHCGWVRTRQIITTL